MAKTYRLTDAGGVVLGIFDDVESAHLWSHRFVQNRATSPPVELHDPDHPTTRRISVPYCELCVLGADIAGPLAGGAEPSCCSGPTRPGSGPA